MFRWFKTIVVVDKFRFVDLNGELKYVDFDARLVVSGEHWEFFIYHDKYKHSKFKIELEFENCNITYSIDRGQYF